MEANEIIMNEEVIDNIGGSAVGKSEKLMKVAGSIAIVVAVSGLAYKYIVKPIVAKIKAKKEATEESEDIVYELEEAEDEAA